jgi:hypothetical protein
MQRPDHDILSARLSVPDNVVQRAFAEETVALNLETGSYHGLNATAARMLERAGECARVGDAVAPLAAEFEQPSEVIERDLLALCRSLSERHLIELHARDTD